MQKTRPGGAGFSCEGGETEADRSRRPKTRAVSLLQAVLAFDLLARAGAKLLGFGSRQSDTARCHTEPLACVEMAPRRPEGGRKRGRGRRPRKPKLLPSGCQYENWRAIHMQPLELVLRELKRDTPAWDDYERRCRVARAAQLEEPDPPPGLWLFIRATAYIPPAERAAFVAMWQERRRPAPAPVVLRDHNGRARGLPATVNTSDVVRWLASEALAHGFACDYATPLQAWFTLAELVLRDVDIGEIVARVYPDRGDRDGAIARGSDPRQLDIDRARKERKRVDRKREAYGYSAR